MGTLEKVGVVVSIIVGLISIYYFAMGLSLVVGSIFVVVTILAILGTLILSVRAKNQELNQSNIGLDKGSNSASMSREEAKERVPYDESTSVDNYIHYDLNLGEGETAVCSVNANDFVSLYITTTRSFNKFEDEQEEIVSIESTENVKRGKVEFTALNRGTWHFVVLNESDSETELDVLVKITSVS